MKDDGRRSASYDFVQSPYMTSATHPHTTAHSHPHLQKTETAMWSTAPEYSQIPPEVLERSTPLSHHSYMTSAATAAAWSSATPSGYDTILHTASGETYRRIEPGALVPESQTVHIDRRASLKVLRQGDSLKISGGFVPPGGGGANVCAQVVFSY
ncbi:hypothetical protein SK128_027047 [Halocaridina rubra]|uniref:Uncharacterized protein n=1 Tax=Halocaridina rubra TaxID=373956 RepID=A0AAN8XDY3_HALRR